MSAIPYTAIGAFAAGFVATLVLAAFFTPRTWWRRANARACAVLAGGTVALGSAMLWLLQPATPAQAAPLASRVQPALSEPRAGKAYVVWDALNLRESRSVGARRVGVVPAGAAVTTTGNSAGDWWEVSARVNGQPVRGWASSLWLRRPDEARK
jgi:hypothetical protein